MPHKFHLSDLFQFVISPCIDLLWTTFPSFLDSVTNLLIAPERLFRHVPATLMTRFGPEGKMGPNR
jgi:hypothetical protein